MSTEPTTEPSVRPSANPVTVARESLAELRGAGPVRLALGALGVVAIAFGGLRILIDHSTTKPVHLAEWLAATVIVHDAFLAPATVAVAWVLAHVIRGRPLAFVQAALAVGALTTLIAIPLIHRRGIAQPGTTLEARNYAVNLAILWVLIALGAAVAYVVTGRLAAAKARKPRSPDAH